MDLDSFLGHSPNVNSGGYTKSWKEKDKATSIDTFLHTKAPILALWRHPMPMIEVREIKPQNGQPFTRREIWNKQLVCHEPEKVLQNWFKRSKETDLREYPPTKCGICLLSEYVRTWVLGGELDWLEPLFKWDGENDKGAVTRVLRAGAMYGAFSSKKLSEDEIKEMTAVGIYQNEAFMHTVAAKCNYAFAVVNADDPGAGCTISIESVSLGDAIKKVIHDQRTSLGKDEGDPFKNPYGIRWNNNPNAKKIQDRYTANPLMRLTPTPEIRDLITGDPPRMDHYSDPFDPRIVRAELEEHCLIDGIPWDSFFPKSIEKEADVKRVVGMPEVNKPVVTVEEQIPCDNCGKSMNASSAKCPHCGQEYDVDPEDEPAPAPKPEPPPAPKAPIARGRRGTPVAASTETKAAPTVSAPPEPVSTPAKAAETSPRKGPPKPPPVGTKPPSPKAGGAFDADGDVLEADIPFDVTHS